MLSIVEARTWTRYFALSHVKRIGVIRAAEKEAKKLVEAKRQLDKAKAALGVADTDDNSPAAIRAFLDSIGVGKENAAPSTTP